MTAKILAFSGSNRKNSYNQRLVEIAVQGARRQGAEVTLIALKDFDIPLYCMDIEKEKGLPADVLKIKQLFLENRGLLIACPEHNGSISAALKNLIDWVSRQADENEPPLACFQGKVATLMSASPGGWGGVRGLPHVRTILSGIGVTVLPKQVSVPQVGDAFAEDGSLKDHNKHQSIEKLGEHLADFLNKIG